MVNMDLEKEEYYQSSVQTRSSVKDKHALTDATTRSCIVCRKTLMFSYFNCCAICLGVIECTRPRNHERPVAADSLPTVEPPRAPPLRLTREASESFSSTSSSMTMVEGHTGSGDEKTARPHCDSTYCKYTHVRPVMVLFMLCELFQLGFSVVFLNMALYCHDWLVLRYSGLIILQWWQLFMLARQASFTYLY